MKPFYLTTPLYYVNDKPHLGTAYSTIISDILVRYHKFFGDHTYFLTGVDEHGQKIEAAAKAKGLDPKNHCDKMSETFKKTWQSLDIQYDHFFRTTSEEHKTAVQSALMKIYDKGDIYQNTYTGWYCMSEEIFYTQKDLVDGKSPSGKEVVKIEEKNYFFKMSKYQDKLIEYIKKNKNFILPESRKNEVLGFLKNPLNDLCISRPKERLSWGIEIPFDKNFVTYVWFDALLNYATGVGYGNELRKDDFEKWWKMARAHHIIGKDILITHAVYWPTMLMSLGLNLPQTIFAHGWLLNSSEEKMSKSSGSVMDPLVVAEKFGTDAMRYYLAKEVTFGKDSQISFEAIAHLANTDLANKLGNLLSRSTNLIEKYFNGVWPDKEDDSSSGQNLKQTASSLAMDVKADIESFNLSQALNKIVNLLDKTNKYMEDTAPWQTVKQNPSLAQKNLCHALNATRIASLLLYPVCPKKIKNLLEQISCDNQGFKESMDWNSYPKGKPVKKGSPLFPRLTV